jgi:nucleoside-diphosphate-sugar epimerase
MSGKRVFLTGGNGFVGANLTQSLVRDGADVHLLVRPASDLYRLTEVLPQITLHTGDLDHIEDVRAGLGAAQPELIFHLAAPSGHPVEPSQKVEMMVSALRGTANLLFVAKEVGCGKIIYSASSTEYGRLNRPFREDDPMDPVTSRGVAKSCSTLFCRQFAQENEIPVSIVRIFSVYGPWEHPSRFIAKAILAAYFARPLPVTEPGFMHDFIYVRDVVDALKLVAEADLPPGETINIGGGRQWSNEEVLLLIEDITGMAINRLPGAFPTRTVDTTFWQADISKAAAVLGWKPRFTFPEGLRDTCEWWKNHAAFGENGYK